MINYIVTESMQSFNNSLQGPPGVNPDAKALGIELGLKEHYTEKLSMQSTSMSIFTSDKVLEFGSFEEAEGYVDSRSSDLYPSVKDIPRTFFSWAIHGPNDDLVAQYSMNHYTKELKREL